MQMMQWTCADCLFTVTRRRYMQRSNFVVMVISYVQSKFEHKATYLCGDVC